MRKGSVTVFIITALIAGAAWLPLAAATISTRNERNRNRFQDGPQEARP